MSIPDLSKLRLCTLPGNRAASQQFYYLGMKLHLSIIKSRSQDANRIITLVCEVKNCNYELTLRKCDKKVSNIKVT
jgi:hypothetical protein